MVSEMDLATTPAVPAPEGETSNLFNPDTEWKYLLPTCIAALVITGPAVSARIFTKLRVHGRLQYEDCETTLIMTLLTCADLNQTF